MALTPEAGQRKWERNFPSWVEKCTLKHGGRYIYPSSERREVGGRWKVLIVCPDHGEFWQSPEKHAFGQGCPLCSGHGTDKVAELKAFFPEFKWPENLVIENTKASFECECPAHGVFTASFNRLATKAARGAKTPCPRCNKEKGGVIRRKAAALWIDEIAQIYGGSVELDPTSVSVASEKARFVCAEHGEFWSILQDVRAGHGCPTCGALRQQDVMRLSFEEFVAAARSVHGVNYTYDEATYVDTKTPTAIICPTHGVFYQRPNNHVQSKHTCPACANGVSSGEFGLREWLESTGVKIDPRNRSVLGGLEIDIFLPEYGIGVEYCGLYWHGEFNKHNTYHQEKHVRAREKGVRLVTVFEDEWLDPASRSRVMFRLLAMLGASTVRMARKLECRRVEWAAAKEFLNLHHMQGAGLPAKACYGLFDDHTLLAVSTWGASRFDKSVEWELLRFSCVNSDRVVGGLGKMFEAFKREQSPRSVVTYADLRWGNGASYGKIGFAHDGDTAPGYFWCKKVSRFSRYDFQKHKLADILADFDPQLSEAENCHRNGYWRIFDCGHSRWIWRAE